MHPTAAQADEYVLDLQWARQTGARLRSEFSVLLNHFSEHTSTITELASHLGITMPIAQRLVRGVRHTGDPLGVLDAIPGSRGLEIVLDAAREKGCPESIIKSAQAAIAEYNRLKTETGGSQNKLLNAIQHARAVLSLPSQPSRQTRVDNATHMSDRSIDEAADPRRAAFEASRLIAGCHIMTHLGVQIYYPTPNADTMSCVSVMGLHKIRRSRRFIPIVLVSQSTHPSNTQSVSALGSLQGTPLDEQSDMFLLDRFCSTPAPQITARPGPDNTLLHFVDVDRQAQDPISVVVGIKYDHCDHPLKNQPHFETTNITLSNGPARNLVHVCFLHRSFAQSCIASNAVFAPSARMLPHKMGDKTPPFDRWFDKLPDQPCLEYLGLGLAHTAHDAYPHMTALIDSLFRSLALDPSVFVGYRCNESYPVWGSQYVMNFDFGSPTTDD